MPTTPEEQIQIRCTNCSQRFKVGSELYGRIVECGACEHRFRVSEDTVIRNKKSYPQDHKHSEPLSFTRHTENGVTDLTHQHIPSYEEHTANRNYEPTPFYRVLAGIIGGFIMALVLLLLVTAGKNSGMLSDMPTDKRMTLALFSSLIGSYLLIFANPRAKIKAGMFALMGSLMLLLAPIFFKYDAETSKTRDKTPLVKADPQEDSETTEEALEKVRIEAGFKPVEKALANPISKKNVIAVWLRGTNDSNSVSVFDYLRIFTRSDDISQLYERPKNKTYLIVLINSSLELSQVALECQRVGEVLRTIPELNLIEVKVANSKFDERPEEVLNDPLHSAFYEMNLMELEGINERRINSALKRLVLAPPTQSRTDMIRRMNQLLIAYDRDEMFTNLSHAVAHWSEGDPSTVEAMSQVVSSRFAKNKSIEPVALRFLVKYNQAAALPILDQLWAKNPEIWEEIYILVGKKAESMLTARFSSTSLVQKLSACRIAARIGTDVSIAQFRELLASPLDQETKTAYELAIRSIEQRLSE